MNIRQKLNRLYGLRAERYQMNKEERLMIEDYEQRIMLIRDEINQKSSDIDEEIQRVENEIKTECLELGQSVHGDELQVIHIKGRVTVDSQKLKREQPGIWSAFTKEGQPSARIAEYQNETKKAV